MDKDFVCMECGKEETWTAAQQKWYYEEAKGSLYATAKRCHDCRMKIKEAKSLQREQMAASKKKAANSRNKKLLIFYPTVPFPFHSLALVLFGYGYGARYLLED